MSCVSECVAQCEHGSQRTTSRDGFLLPPADAGSTSSFLLLSVLQASWSKSSQETLTSTDHFPTGVLESQMRATTSGFPWGLEIEPKPSLCSKWGILWAHRKFVRDSKWGNGFNFMVIAQSWHQNPKEEYIKIKSKANLNHEHECKNDSKNPLQMLIKLDTGH